MKEIELQRSESLGFGFSIIGGLGSELPPVICDIVEDSPADHCDEVSWTFTGENLAVSERGLTLLPGGWLQPSPVMVCSSEPLVMVPSKFHSGHDDPITTQPSAYYQWSIYLPNSDLRK